METEKPDAQPKRETGKTEEQGGESQKGPAAPPPVVEPAHSETERADAEDPKDEADREQDEAIEELAEQSEAIAQQTVWMERQTKWMAEQTRWVRNQFWAAVALGLITFFVLAYQAVKMSGQLDATNETVEVMRGQLESMQSGSNQTQQTIDALQKQANATQDLASAAGKQANASETQAGASQTQANASVAQAEVAKQSLGAAQSSARAAEQSAEVAERTFRLTVRPELAIQTVKAMNIELGKKPLVEITFVNAGNATAYDARLISNFGLADAPPLEATDGLKGIEAGTLTTITPKATRSHTHVFELELTPEMLNHIQRGVVGIYIYGGGQYKDGYGRQYAFTFRFVYNPETKLFRSYKQ